MIVVVVVVYNASALNCTTNYLCCSLLLASNKNVDALLFSYNFTLIFLADKDKPCFPVLVSSSEAYINSSFS